jgi:hypothetical protein
MRELESHALHAFDHRRGRRGAGHHRLHAGGQALLHLVGRVHEHAVHDGRAAVVRDAIRLDRIDDRLRLDLAQAHVHAGPCRDRPRKAPAVAVEHRQRPQVDRVLAHVPFEDVGDRVHRRAAVVVHDAFRVAGRAARVIERDGVPFVGGQLPGKRRIAAREEVLVVDAADALHGAGEQRVRHVDGEQGRFPFAQRERLLHHASEFRVDDHGFRFTVVQHERDRLRIEARVERIEHGACHGDAEMRLDHRRRVRQHHGHRVALADAIARQGTGQALAARVHLAPGAAQVAVHDSEALRVDVGSALDERQRRQRREIRFVARQVLVENGSHVCLLSFPVIRCTLRLTLFCAVQH